MGGIAMHLVSASSQGAIRFICECGPTFTEGFEAILHTFDGHEVVRERFSLGEWRFLDTLDGRSVAEIAYNKLKLDGESPERFVARFKAMTDAAEERAAAIEEAEREMGIHG